MGYPLSEDKLDQKMTYITRVAVPPHPGKRPGVTGTQGCEIDMASKVKMKLFTFAVIAYCNSAFQVAEDS